MVGQGGFFSQIFSESDLNRLTLWVQVGYSPDNRFQGRKALKEDPPPARPEGKAEMVAGKPIKFKGEATHSLDEKGRLTLPGSVRSVLNLSRSPDILWLGWMPGDACINAYPVETMELLEAEWDDPKRYSTTRQQTDYMRLFNSRLETVAVDKAGRILLPPKKRKLANIDKEVVISGNGDKFELWNPDLLEDKLAKTGDEYLAQSACQPPPETLDPPPRLPRC